MTTPERLRRRQRIEGAVLIILAICMLIQAWYFHSRDVGQRNCVANQFHQLASVQRARAELVDQDSKSTDRVITSVAQAKSKSDVQVALSMFLATQKKITAERETHKIPPFPPGSCK